MSADGSVDRMAQLLASKPFLTLAGIETYLIFLQGVPLREFCAFELIEDEAAWSVMEKEFLLDPGFAEAHNNLGSAWKSQGRLEDAVASYARAAELDRRSTSALSNLAIALHERGRYEDALARAGLASTPMKP